MMTCCLPDLGMLTVPANWLPPNSYVLGVYLALRHRQGVVRRTDVLVPNQIFQVMYVGIQITWSVVTGFPAAIAVCEPSSGYGVHAVGLGDAFGRAFSV